MSHNLIIEPNLKKHKKLNLLAQKVSEMNSLILAYSGGVDSTFLAAISNYVLGDNMIAVIADSPSLPKSELEYAIEFKTISGFSFSIILLIMKNL